MAARDFVHPIDVSTRPKRRKAVLSVIALLDRVLAAEEAYLERVPLNLQGGAAYASAEECVE
ncbi:MAG: hypothetical protein LBH85_05045, partial [Treponema sp.]|nr:hypothetical protein [Treponema sp.]